MKVIIVTVCGRLNNTPTTCSYSKPETCGCYRNIPKALCRFDEMKDREMWRFWWRRLGEEGDPARKLQWSDERGITCWQ